MIVPAKSRYNDLHEGEDEQYKSMVNGLKINSNEDDDDLLEFEERKDQVKDL